MITSYSCKKYQIPLDQRICKRKVNDTPYIRTCIHNKCTNATVSRYPIPPMKPQFYDSAESI